ncbi:hypothetical protein [Streptomyces sp. NPDC093707]|uniref:hypothetical protein n=1 Tax=Streptomyces sp. NPDC093707 TaxID=3154984 RepID=UPI00344FEE1F
MTRNRPAVRLSPGGTVPRRSRGTAKPAARSGPRATGAADRSTSAHRPGPPE